MSVIYVLETYFRNLNGFWNSSYDTLPQVPFDELLNPMLYQGEPDERHIEYTHLGITVCPFVVH